MDRATSPRCTGTVLIVVAGIAALLMSLTVAFLANMRSDIEESHAVVREAQARLVLIAALQYIQESSRLGWDNPLTPEHEEAYGWADVRDGSPGPKDRLGNPLYQVGSGVFPDIGGRAARFPLHVMERPPYALTNNFVYNPAPLNGALDWRDLVNYTNLDPQPAVNTWDEFKNGETQARPESVGLSWMRIYRERNRGSDKVEPATFTITCGAGPTQGFRDWNEVIEVGQTDLFNNDRAYFYLLRSQERVMWYRTEWTSAVGGSGMGIRMRNGLTELPELNKESYYKGGSYDVYSGTLAAGSDHHWWVNRNPVGSLLWIQRLDHEPADW
jgi:hypothetical protein